MAAQTIEQFLVEQLEKVAPGKYTLANVLQLFKTKLRFPCTHLKGGRNGLTSGHKDYNLSIFTFPTGVTEIKCLYNCGLKIRSDQPELVSAFRALKDLPTSNTRATSEVMRPLRDLGPVPTYTDEYRQRIKDSNDTFLEVIERGLESGCIKLGDTILGGVFPHPDPIEAPDTIIERGLKLRHARQKNKPPVLKATAVVQDSVPALELVKSNKKIRKARKTQSRQRKRSGSKGSTQ